MYTCGSGGLKAESTRSRNGAVSDPSRLASFSRSLFLSSFPVNFRIVEVTFHPSQVV